MYPGSLKLEALQMSQECWNVGSFKPPSFLVESFLLLPRCFQSLPKKEYCLKNGELLSHDSSVSDLYAVEMSLRVTFSSRRSGAPKVFSFQLNNGSIGLVTSGMATRMNTSAERWGHFKGPKPIRRIMMDRLLHDSPAESIWFRSLDASFLQNLTVSSHIAEASSPGHLPSELWQPKWKPCPAVWCYWDAACHGLSYAFICRHTLHFPPILDKWLRWSWIPYIKVHAAEGCLSRDTQKRGASVYNGMAPRFG